MQGSCNRLAMPSGANELSRDSGQGCVLTSFLDCCGVWCCWVRSPLLFIMCQLGSPTHRMPDKRGVMRLAGVRRPGATPVL